MKKTLLSLAVIGLALSACNNTPTYTINGTLEGEQTGTAYLLKVAGSKADTLAQAPIAEGKFTLTGTTENLTDAYLNIAGKRVFLPIMLENAQYTANINLKDPAAIKVEGTETQQLLNQFTAISQQVNKKSSELNQQYFTARQANDEAKMQEIADEFNKVQEDFSVQEDKLIQANGDTYVAAFILAQKMSSIDDIAELQKKYDMLGANAKATEPGKKIAERIQKMQAVAVGQVAPDFTLNTPEGEALSMHSIKGKVKILDFWASWCGPCRGENPNVVKIYVEYHPKGVEILSLSLDSDKDDWVKAIADDKLTWNHVSDLQGWQNAAAQTYGVSGIPHLVILDENNVIIAKDLRGDALKEKVAELLK